MDITKHASAGASAMSVYATSAVTGIMCSFLPFDHHLNMMIGMLTCESLKQFGGKLFGGKLFGNNTYLLIKPESNGIHNSIYTTVEKYMIENHIKKINGCEVVSKFGDIDFKMIDNKSFTDKYLQHTIILYIKSIGKEGLAIMIESKTATIIDLQNYVKDIGKISSKSQYTKLLTCIAYVIEKTKHNPRSVHWNEMFSRTNKNVSNTIVSKEVQSEFYEDVHQFMNNSKWYAEKGIPYKRGYLLHGNPGCGKTSLIKAIASNYNIPLYIIELESLHSNDELISLITSISCETNYILVFEDVDRSPLFNNNMPHYIDSKSQPNIRCLLNVLDGIIETHGRIVIFTANAPENITRYPAIVRPGRIDKIIEIKQCDRDQVQRMLCLFYDIDMDNDDISNIKYVIPRTPAELIKIFQQFPSPNNLCKVISILTGEQNIVFDEDKDKDLSKVDILRMEKKKLATLKREIAKISKYETKIAELTEEIKQEKKRAFALKAFGF